MTTNQSIQWHRLCFAEDLVADAGVAAWSPAGPVALFWLPERQALFCIAHYDPLGQAHVLARGILGDSQGEPVVASPLYKQHYSLISGRCLEAPEVSVPVHAVRQVADRIEMALPRVLTQARDQAEAEA